MTESEDFVWPDGWRAALPAIRQLVRAIAVQMGLNDADADDLFQIIAFKVWLATFTPVKGKTEIRHFPNIPALCGWLRKTVYGDASRLRAKKHRLSTLADPTGVSEIPARATEPSIDEFDQYLAMVPDERARRVLELTFREYLTLEEIGHQLNVSKTTAFNLLTQGLADIRKRLTQ